ncbi:probable 26S proteasome non-ATPase regulatory subunit 9 [Anopheles ziemanni]|uniref:probable 26S proteasome non-ATPase regulatory subunit 9 n=1 Tax=Anopheles coustani TaxID=139045 RepID=UPI0026591B3A|nr:probable 26S proteasome non-ATPase regulatory subunit 9 [Anopheles coustani]XP_058176267.1 probable 26S proteasome non-ATPase regulatory subunit 9 [Anopheles ziemanni]
MMPFNGNDLPREELLEMIREKDKLDRKINDLGKILEANKIGMKEPLVDNEGYPRNDIDVAAVRHARRDIICLQNERSALYEQIHTALGAFHKQQKEKTVQSHNTPQHNQQHHEPMDVSESNSAKIRLPFITVQTVVPGLGADQAGLKAGDQILQMGSLSASNFKSMQQVKTILDNSAGRTVRLLVRKADSNDEAFVNIVPPKLGIAFLPINK